MDVAFKYFNQQVSLNSYHCTISGHLRQIITISRKIPIFKKLCVILLNIFFLTSGGLVLVFENVRVEAISSSKN